MKWTMTGQTFEYVRNHLIFLLIIAIVVVAGCLGGGGGGGGGGGPVGPLPPDNQDLQIRLVTPENNSRFVAGKDIVLSAVTIALASTIVQKVEFYQFATKLGEVAKPPYIYLWKNVGSGSYELFARAINLTGAATDSAKVSITVGEGNLQELVISITQPAPGSTFTFTDTIAIVASATRPSGSIVLVEFFDNGLPLGSSTAAPYSFSWVTPSLGAHLLTARAIDNLGIAKTSDPIPVTIATFVNKIPTVSITQPPAGTQFPPGSSITIGAAASDIDGTVAKVEFFAGSLLLGVSQAQPFNIVWQNAQAGVYQLIVKATDNLGGVSIPASIPIKVGQAEFSFAQPPNNFVASTGQAVALVVDLSRIASPVQRVEYYRDFTQKIGESAISPTYSLSWMPPGAGSYIITARAYLYDGSTKDSSVILFSVVEGPRVSIASPSKVLVLAAGSNVSIVASASAQPGTLTQVELYRNGTLLVRLLPPNLTSYLWANVPSGIYSLTASATDNFNITNGWASVSIVLNSLPQVSITCPPNGLNASPGSNLNIAATAIDLDGTIQEVRFYDGTKLLGSDMIPPYQYSWNGLTSGTHDLTAVAVDNYAFLATSTLVRIAVGGPAVQIASPSAGPVVFSIASGSLGTANFTLVANASDAVFVISSMRMYSNGQLIGNSAQSPLTVNWIPSSWGVYSITASATNTNNDVGESLPSSITLNDIPTIAIASPAGGVTIAKGTNLTNITLLVGNIFGAISSMELYGNGSLLSPIPATSSNPLVFSRTFAVPGIFTLTASAADNYGATGSSAVGPTITVYDLPLVTISAPASNTVLTGPPLPIDIQVTASATIGDGSITGVQFFANGASLGTDNSAPYSVSWPPAAYGVYSLTASATDNRGGIGTSAAVLFTVNDAPTVQITSPTADVFIPRYSTVSDITLVAANSVGSIKSMEVYLNGNLENPGMNSNPLLFTKTFTTPGVFSLSASVTDSLLATGSHEPAPPIKITVIDLPAQATVPAVLVNNGDPSSIQASVTLTINAPGQVAMRLSNDLNFNLSSDEAPPGPHTPVPGYFRSPQEAGRYTRGFKMYPEFSVMPAIPLM